MPDAEPEISTKTSTKRSLAASRRTAPAQASLDARYSIRIASNLAGIEIYTLRMWERRYGFPRPARTPGGSRTYSPSDVESLKLIRRALELGYRPGEVVGKSNNELMQLILGMSGAVVREPLPVARAVDRNAMEDDALAPSVSWLLDALCRDDLEALRSGLRRSAIALGPKGFLTERVHPICVQVGALWAEGKVEVRHEHMLSECLSAQLQVMMTAYEHRAAAPRVVLAALPGERHGLGLEMIQLYLAVSHVTPLLIGADTPAEQIVKAARGHAADAVGVLVTEASDLKATAKHLRWMKDELPRRVSIWIGGAASPALKMKERPRVIVNWADLDAAIDALPQRAA